MPLDMSAATSDFASCPSALALDPAPVDSSILQIGIIGCGRIGWTHAKSITSKIPQATIVCVSDVFESAARKLAAAFDIPMACTDANDLITNPAVQAVIVCSPTDTHAGIIKAAVAAGKHIFCEKPVDKSLKVINELEAVLKDSDVKFFLGFQRRFDVHFNRARQARDDGYIGKPLKLHLISRDPAPPPVGYLKQSGGLFLDMSSHDFDMARYLIGSDITEITATGMADNADIGAIGDVDHTMVMCRFENGAIAVIDNSRSCSLGYDQRAEFFGTEGSILVDNVIPNNCSYTNADGYHSDKPLSFFMDRYADAYVEEMTQFVDVCVNDKDVPVGIHDGRLTVLYAAAANLSIKEKRTVSIKELDGSPSENVTEAKARY